MKQFTFYDVSEKDFENKKFGRRIVRTSNCNIASIYTLYEENGICITPDSENMYHYITEQGKRKVCVIEERTMLSEEEKANILKTAKRQIARNRKRTCELSWEEVGAYILRATYLQTNYDIIEQLYDLCYELV